MPTNVCATQSTIVRPRLILRVSLILVLAGAGGAFLVAVALFLMWSYLFASIMPRPWDQPRTPLPALLAAVEAGDLDVVKSRIAAGDPVDDRAYDNARWPDGTTSLMIAANNGDVALLELLLSSGAAVDARLEHSGVMPIHLAAAAAIDVLVAHGADVNARTRSGQTPLMTAAVRARTSNDLSAVQKLLAAGADVNARDAQGRTVIELLRTWPDPDPHLIRLLEDAGAR